MKLLSSSLMRCVVCTRRSNPEDNRLHVENTIISTKMMINYSFISSRCVKFTGCKASNGRTNLNKKLKRLSKEESSKF
jgi:hypothetical protein